MTKGTGMAADIAEQPEVFARLLDERTAEIAAIAAVIAERRPRHVVFTARGTSDHAALYGAYLTEIPRHSGRPGLAVGDHRLRRAPRPAGLPGGRGVTER